jgi:hypothetical protein
VWREPRCRDYVETDVSKGRSCDAGRPIPAEATVKTSPSLFRQWVGVACLVGAVAFQVSTVVREGVTGGTMPGVLLGLGTAAIIVIPFFVRDFLRLRAVRAAHPGAFVASGLVFPELVSQMNVLAGLLGLRLINVSYGRHVVVVIDSSGFTLFVGGSRPKVLFSGPGSRLLAARIVSTRQGRWILPCVEVEFEVGGEIATLDLPIAQTWHGLPHTAHRKALERILPELAKFVVAAR